MVRRTLILWLSLAACATAPPAGPPSLFSPVPAAGALEVRIIDVGQGDAILIRSATGETALIDAGPGSGGKKVARECERLGIRRIDHAILSHAHQDHMGGYLRLFDKVEVGAVVDPGFAHGTKTYARFLKHVEDTGLPYIVARRGLEIPLGPQAKLVILGPEDPLFRGTRSDANANSLVARLDVGEVCMVFTGDAELETEERIVASKQRLRCPVLKVAHHGSKHSTSDGWVAAVKAKVAIVSVGRRNRYGHPDDGVIRRLEASGARVYRTDLDGTVVIRTDGRRVMIITETANPERVPREAVPPATAVGGSR